MVQHKSIDRNSQVNDRINGNKTIGRSSIASKDSMWECGTPGTVDSCCHLVFVDYKYL
jgi:hypothetical protein